MHTESLEVRSDRLVILLRDVASYRTEKDRVGTSDTPPNSSSGEKPKKERRKKGEGKEKKRKKNHKEKHRHAHDAPAEVPPVNFFLLNFSQHVSNISFFFQISHFTLKIFSCVAAFVYPLHSVLEHASFGRRCGPCAQPRTASANARSCVPLQDIFSLF